MVLLNIRQEAVAGRVDEDQLQAISAREVADALLEAVDSRENGRVETGYWSYSMPSPGVRYYAFYGPLRPRQPLARHCPRLPHGTGLAAACRDNGSPENVLD